MQQLCKIGRFRRVTDCFDDQSVATIWRGDRGKSDALGFNAKVSVQGTLASKGVHYMPCDIHQGSVSLKERNELGSERPEVSTIVVTLEGSGTRSPSMSTLDSHHPGGLGYHQSVSDITD